MRLTFKARLTIGTLIISSLVFGVGALFFLSQFRTSVQATTDLLLRNDSRSYVVAIAAMGPEENGADGASNSTGNSGNALDPPAQGQLIALIDPKHKVALSTLPRVFQGQYELLSSTVSPTFLTVSRAGQNYRVMRTLVHAWNGNWVVIAVRNDSTAELITSKVTKSLFFGILLLILLSGVASWILASSVLRPIRKMHLRALELIDDPSSGVLPAGKVNDELSELALTLNRLIVEFRTALEREQRMVSDASHELRTPMAQLLAQLELSKLNAGNSDELLRDIQAASKSAGRVSALASDLLFLSHKQAEPKSGTAGREAIIREVSEAIDHGRILDPSKNLDIDYNVIDAQDVRVSAQDFRRVLDNLLGNAVSNCPSNARIMIEVEIEGSFLLLNVKDTGPGFPEAFLPVAFDRFSRPDRSRHSSTGGSGLGLAIVKAIAESSGGYAKVENLKPHGAQISVFLGLV